MNKKLITYLLIGGGLSVASYLYFKKPVVRNLSITDDVISGRLGTKDFEVKNSATDSVIVKTKGKEYIVAPKISPDSSDNGVVIFSGKTGEVIDTYTI